MTFRLWLAPTHQERLRWKHIARQGRMLSLYLLLICDIILFLFGLSLELKPTASAFLALSLWSRLKRQQALTGLQQGKQLS